MDDNPIAQAYDEVPYPAWAHASTHPDRLATIARLHGLTPAPVGACRVLELGCGDGGNLIPMAVTAPGSHFVGIDLSELSIARGVAAAEAAGVTNVTLLAADLTTFDPGPEPFDYIIAHGLYAWVPPEVQAAALALIGESLGPQGVAYVSYNTMPGGHIRLMLREMMLFHIGEGGTPSERTTGAMGLMGILAKVPPRPGDHYATLVAAEAERLAKREPAIVYHDELAPVNDPVYLTEFLSAAAEHGLQFLGEADYFEMFSYEFPADVVEALREAQSQSRVLREQYLDFLVCRRFRKTLVCQEAAEVQDDPDPRALFEMWVSSGIEIVRDAKPAPPPGFVSYRHVNGATFSSGDTALNATLRRLSEVAPLGLAFADLVEVAGRYAAPAAKPNLRDELAAAYLGMYQGLIVELSTVAPPFVVEPDRQPEASRWARYQAEAGLPGVTSLNHINVWLETDLMRATIPLLDGTRDRAAIIAGLGELLPADGAEARRKLHEVLAHLGKSGVLRA